MPAFFDEAPTAADAVLEASDKDDVLPLDDFSLEITLSDCDEVIAVKASARFDDSALDTFCVPLPHEAKNKDVKTIAAT